MSSQKPSLEPVSVDSALGKPSWRERLAFKRNAWKAYERSDLAAFQSLLDRGFDANSLSAEVFFYGRESVFYTSVIQNRLNWTRAMWSAGARPYSGDAQMRGLLHAMAALSVGGAMMRFLIECDAGAILIPWRVAFKGIDDNSYTASCDACLSAVMAGNVAAATPLVSALRFMIAEGSTDAPAARASLMQASEKARTSSLNQPLGSVPMSMWKVFDLPAPIATESLPMPIEQEGLLPSTVELLERLEKMQSQIDLLSHAPPLEPRDLLHPSAERPKRTPPLAQRS